MIKHLAKQHPGQGWRLTVSVKLACACCGASLALTDFLIYAHRSDIEEYFSIFFVNQCFWLAPIPAVLILRRFAVATKIYAVILAAILIASGADLLQYLASGFLPKLTWADMGAFAVSAISMFIILMWAANLLTLILFNMLMLVFGKKKDG